MLIKFKWSFRKLAIKNEFTLTEPYSLKGDVAASM